MNLLRRLGLRRGSLIILLSIVFGLTIIYLYHAFYSRDPEIALVIGEPYEAMRQRSSAKISPPYDNSIGFRIPKTDARLRFTDPKYGFITPPARFFTVSYNKGIIENVRMSPQIEPLLYDDAIKIVLDLQDQWRKAGWTLTLARESPALANTPELRAKLRSLIGSEVTYWQAGEQYQIMLIMARFKDDRHPDEERYLITLAIAEPWVKNYSD
ncbi:hypothetical protein XBJ2_610003 [Xenorhabdus bovienii str. Jollieti]|uniref:Uncharacterized protein n=1 Tax=Xenorhabdus bovienii (strain SS-2004) TaxID=406818 RepID=D3UXT3_XENBS|nr:hypothetical protein [Xenorhabdus bovienii]MDE9446819.1 hypothetical protein [Xenorhabdus bovienii]CBJ80458.1 hypothetical protein XBJ1_1325 [Xenorhabdus bovienii SS-2004]CDH30219.1 hypothetical protein XBJ2_610003 [Xenorhabdus bovienii str. Jollieti]